MKIEHSAINKMVITGAPSLDPITVYAEDIAPRQGKITIECYGKSWSAYWGGMGSERLAKFFSSVSTDYAANCLDRGIAASIFDPDGVKAHVKRQICKDRRSHELNAEIARGLFDDIDSESIGDDPWQNSEILQKVYGSEWWYALPEKPNPDYVYLCRIVTAVQSAFCSEMVPA
jgi:hypothetical protein